MSKSEGTSNITSGRNQEQEIECPPVLSNNCLPLAKPDSNAISNDTTISQMNRNTSTSQSDPTDDPIPSHISFAEWPPSVPSHARLLQDSFETVIENCRTYGSDAVLISYDDLDKLWKGTMALRVKIVMAYGALLEHLPPEERADYETESDAQLERAVNGAEGSVSPPAECETESTKKRAMIRKGKLVPLLQVYFL